jgi:site-specific recombinase XerD
MEVIPMDQPIRLVQAAAADPWWSLWESFERSMRAEGAAARTVDMYRDAAEVAHGFLLNRGYPLDPAAMEKRHIEEFLIHLREERGAAPATVRARFSALRRFFNFLLDEGEIEHSPMARMRGPKVDEPPPEVLSEEELIRLLRACEGRGFEERRDMALIRLMIDTGLRRFEAAGIQLTDLDLSGQQVRIVGKGGHEGVVFFGAKVARDLDRYLRARVRHHHAALPALWLSQKGALTGDGVHHLVQRRAKLAGIERPVWPHLLRHSFAHAMKSAGNADEVVMTLGRWRDPKVMRRYGASAALQRARDAHRASSPGDRL